MHTSSHLSKLRPTEANPIPVSTIALDMTIIFFIEFLSILMYIIAGTRMQMIAELKPPQKLNTLITSGSTSANIVIVTIRNAVIK